jgi:predicted metalloendopeptidase
MRRLLVAVAATLAACAARADIDTSCIDASVSPAVDFYSYAVGSWVKRSTIPSDKSIWSADEEISDADEAILRQVVQDAIDARSPSPAQRMVADFYASGMDLRTIDALGIKPLKPELDAIDSIDSQASLDREIARLFLDGTSICFGFGSSPDLKDSNRVIASLIQGGLGLPDRDYYLRKDAESLRLKADYEVHVARMLELSGLSPTEAKAGAAAVMRIENAFAVASKSANDLRDPAANSHPMGVAELSRLAPHFDFGSFFSGIGIEPPAVVDVGQPDFLRAMDALLASESLSDWKAYFRWHMVHDLSAYLSTPLSDEGFAFFGTRLYGIPERRERWRRVLTAADSNIGDALGQLFVAKAFPPESKERMLKMVANLRAVLRERISTLEWMDKPTRDAALRKLDLLNVKIGYPDKWIDYSSLSIDRGPYVLNVLRATQFLERRDLSKIGKPADRTQWDMTAPTVNAYYSDQFNEIVFPAGYLRPPEFDPSADDAVNYGAIGATIGHEMTHGFDDTGRLFDGHGNLVQWWTPESEKHFKERAVKIIRQFNDMVAIGDLHVNGELTEGENIADLGGLKIAYAAFMRTRAGKADTPTGGFTPQQRFFLSFANCWRTLQRPEDLREQVQTDPHAPNKLRVNGPLSNMPEFAEAFHVPEGSPMRRPAAERVEIW